MAQDYALNDIHELQVQSYLRFAKLKRDQHVREAVSVITDYQKDKLQPGEMYNYKDLYGLFQEMHQEMRDLVDKEIQHAYHTNALLVKILLSQAQANGLEFLVDTNQLENEFLLKQISASEKLALSRPASDFVRRQTQLSKIGTVATVNLQTEKERDKLEGDVASLQQRLQKLQEQTTQMMQDRTNLNNTINALRDEVAQKDAMLKSSSNGQSNLLAKLQADFAELSTAAAGAAQTSQVQFKDLERQLNQERGEHESTRRMLAQAQHELTQREGELRGARDDIDAKLMNSPQFRQMQKMMQQKSTEVVALRKQLGKYEPQSVPTADGNDDGY